MHDFRKLEVWNEAIEIVVLIYQLTEKFPNEEMYGLKTQMRRSAVSIPSNIAEGSGRNNPGGFYHFLGIASGSSFELETQIILSQRLGLFTMHDSELLLKAITINQKKIFRLQKSIIDSKNN